MIGELNLESERTEVVWCLVVPPLLDLYQTIAIENRVHGADRGWFGHGILAQQLVADLAGTPGRVIPF